jgi:hypothetical protein
MDLLKGEYSDPVRVIGYNTSEGWSRDVSEEVASELQYRCDRLGLNAPANLEGFIERHELGARGISVKEDPGQGKRKGPRAWPNLRDHA